MNRKMNKWHMGLAVLVLCALLFITALPSAANYAYDGFEIKNMINGTVQGDVFASYGSNGGLASSPYTTSYTVPIGTVKWARLYVGIWGGNEANTGWVNTTLNGNSLGNVTLGGTGDSNPTYSSGTNAYSSGNGVWMVSYNSTNNVTSGSNSATATTGGSIDGRVYGIVLVVVYENTSLPKIQYWVNEGNPNLNYVTPLNNNFTWFNGTAYNSTEANLTVMQYTGSLGQPDYLYFNPPDASDSPFNLSNIRWNVTKYRTYQMDSNDVADASEGGYFDFDIFTSTNNSTALKNIVNTSSNNYAIFWRGWDTNNNGTIDYDAWNQSDEGETYVHPILAVLKLKNITLYDFSLLTPGTDGWAFKYQVDGSPGPGDPSIEFNTTEYAAIKANDGVFACNTTTDDLYYAAHRFNFSISENASVITAINVTWNGKGWHDTLTDGAKLYIWNFTSAAYEQLDTDTQTPAVEVTLTGEKTSSVSNYISPSGNVTILVNQTSAQTSVEGEEGTTYYRSHICTDYVKLVVTPDP